ncbi:MAG: hypothetical protein AMQ22_00438 [Candidatus Methanofastidiosum methylothiophilum]|uniref:Uncharacterized protein n=1 Tax=Candidatus Methanofastidiosum methylothiophilum TaxID=1705564 RepID=A0A150J7G2_9EURY|nr:MAG: hypothetical protein AMQ22_00438 [Candidatus Methanofastidiosum methylthiophilus]
MRKIFSILFGLLLLGSIFGITSVVAPSEQTQCYVHAGDTLTIGIYYEATECQTFEIINKGTSDMTLISGPVCYDETSYKITEYTYVIRNAGMLDLYIDGHYVGVICNVLPKPQPIKKFMDILNLGKEK